MLTTQEFLQIIAALKSNYPNWQFNLKDKTTLNFWYENLKHIPYQVLQLGIRKLIAEEEFYPNIAKILKAVASITNAPTTDATEAWGMVQRAIRIYGYMRAEEALQSLPVDVAKAVNSMGGWQVICQSENIEADRAHFYKTMQSIDNREKSNSLLSSDLLEQINCYHKIDLKNKDEQEKNRLSIENEKIVKQIVYIEQENQPKEETKIENIHEILEKLKKDVEARKE